MSEPTAHGAHDEPPPGGAGTTTLALPREMILASAGSGKTFRISSRLLALLTHGAPPDAILASTFTRKAAGEILGRVLVRLAEAALDPVKAEELAKHAVLEPESGAAIAATAATGAEGSAAEGGEDGGGAARMTGAAGTTSVPSAGAALDCDRCLALLVGLARRLHRLNVSTLDAFFIRAAQSFAHELGLPPGWSIADEPTRHRLRSEALQEVLHRGDPGTVVELVRLANRGLATRSVHEGLLKQLDDLLEIYHQLDPATPDPWTLYPGLGRAAERAAEGAGAADADAGASGATTGAGTGAQPVAGGVAGAPAAATDAGIVRLAEAIESIDPPRTGAGAPRKHWVHALARAGAAIRAGDWEGFIGLTLTQKVLTAEPTFDRGEITEDVRQLFEEALEVACRVLGRRLSAQLGALGRLVALFDEALARRQREEGAYRFDDVTRLLGGPSALGERADLYYRLDARLRHLLLDEFQDTSVPQWTALRPLVDGLLAGDDGERAVVIVADPKQSIYGWRGASPALVYGVAERYALERDVLARSWRSSPVVLDAVNAVFEGIAESSVLDAADRDVAAAWARAFTPHEAAHELPGHVRLLVGPDDPGRGQHRPRLLARAAELVRDLREETPEHGIGVLVRTNKAVARIIHELRRLGIEASEEGGNPLTDSAAVASVLALLQLADHPDDRVARYHVARTPLGAAVGFQEWHDDGAARRLARRTRERLLRDGYGAMLNALAGQLLPACDARDARRLLQLVELAFRYEARATLRPTDFTRVVAAERIEDPTSAPVRVMTIHQSKGLEFDVVVLPELDVSIFRGGGAGVLAYREDPTGPVTRVFPYAGEKLRPLFPEIDAAWRQQRDAALRDALSMLYVAMTRARHALHLLIKPDGKHGPGTAKTPARIVREALAPEQAAAEGDVLFEAGDPAWYVRAARARQPAGDVQPGRAGSGDAAPAGTAPGAPGGVPGVRGPDIPRPGTVAPARVAPAAAVPGGGIPGGAAPGGVAPAVIAPRLRESPPRRRRLLPRRSPSGLEGGTTVDLALRLRLDTGHSLERGSLVHAWCQEIGWIEDGLPDDERLHRIARRAAPGLDAEHVATLIERFRGWIDRAELRDALRRDAYPPGARVERELRFAHRSGDAIIEGLVDRLVHWTEDGRVAGADVLDFKTDAIAEDDAGELTRRTEFYRPQLSAYRAAVAALYGLDPARVRARLVFLRAGVVREV